MLPLRIAAPSAAAAFLLVDKLAPFGARAESSTAGKWDIIVPLRGARREAVPTAIAATRDWLDECGLESTSMTIDGHTHLLRGSGSRLGPMRS